jgi:alkaline phosphatase D
MSTNIGNPFTLGVASGYPKDDSVVLWTRLAPDPLNGGGMGSAGDISIGLEIATDSSFTNIIQSVQAVAEAKYAHSVHHVVSGLQHNTHYWYRFSYKGFSAMGRTLTAGAGDREDVKFAFVNCQNLQEGFYPVYRDIAQDYELDLVVHLGDYIYESAPAPGGPRQHRTKAPIDLASFRNRHADYRMDKDLQAAHAAHPWVVTWDDHEVENDYAGNSSWYDQLAFARRRAGSYQAYYEHMPLPHGFLRPKPFENVSLYGKVGYGDLLQFLVLDVRQYRTLQPCGDRLTDCPERYDPKNDILGPQQEGWLKANLSSQSPQWSIIANSIFMLEYDHDPSDSGGSYYVDGWDGYPHSRARLFKHLYDNRVPNPVVISGDIHAAWVADLKYHPDDALGAFRRDDSVTIATEFIGTSVTSTLSSGWTNTYRRALSKNPHVKYFDERPGGYVRCVVTRDNFRAEYKLALNVVDRLSPVKTVATFEAAAEGNPNLRKGATKVETLTAVKLVEPEPDYRVVGWRWAEGYGSGREGYWLLPRQLKLSDGTYIEIEQLKRG